MTEIKLNPNEMKRFIVSVEEQLQQHEQSPETDITVLAQRILDDLNSIIKCKNNFKPEYGKRDPNDKGDDELGRIHVKI